MKVLNSLNTNKDILYILLGISVIIIALYPFWLFGEYSALGWYDEMDSHIPWNSIKHSGDNFYYNWAGGVGSKFGYSIEHISFYRILIDIFPVWIANNIIRFFSLFTLFLGIYIFNKTFFNSSSLLAFSSGLFALFASYYPYGWTLGGMGYDLSIAIWLLIALFAPFKNIKTNYIIGIVTVLFAPIVSNFIFSFVLSFFLLLAIFISFFDRIKIQKSTIYLWLSIGVLYVFFMLLNWSNIFYQLNEAKEFSSRLMGILDYKQEYSGNFQVFIEVIKTEWYHFLKLLDKFSLPVTHITFIVIFVLVIVKNKYLEVILSFLVIIFIPILLLAIGETYDLGVFSTYRWTIIWLLTPLMIPILIVYLISIQNVIFTLTTSKVKYITIVLTIIMSVVFLYQSFKGAKILSDMTIHNLHYRNGNTISFYYEDLKSLKNEDYRVVTDRASRMWWALPQYYGLNSFDGIQLAMPHRRTYFIAYGLYDFPLDKLHHSKHFLSFSPKKKLYNLNILQMANVKYILSHNKKISFDLKKDMIINGIKVKDVWEKNDFVYQQFKKKNVAKTLYVYKLEDPWEKVFVVSKINKSEYSYKSKPFYNELKNIQKYEVLIAKDDWKKIDKPSINRLKIENYKLIDNLLNIQTNGQKGVIVFNQVYTPQWSAQCKGRKVDIIPVNGIMMAVKIEQGCTDLQVKYGIK